MTQRATNQTTKISSFVLLVVVVTLLLSFFALVVAINAYSTDPVVAGWLIMIGFVGVALSAYVLLQVRRRVRSLSIEIPPVTTTIECTKCGFKNVREFQRGDFIFKEADTCQKCNSKTMITAIYREVKEGQKERSRI